MQSPTSAIITSIAAASGSSTQPMRSAFSPKLNQVKLWTARKPAVCSVRRNAKIDNASATTWPMTASAAALLRRGFAKLNITSEMASGIAGISQRLVISQLMGRFQSRAGARVQNSSFELVELIDAGRSIVAVNGYDQRKADSGFGGGDGDGENRDHHAGGFVRLGAEAPEGDKIQIRRGEHHLDADQNKNGVAPAQGCKQPDAKQRSGYDEENLEC